MSAVVHQGQPVYTRGVPLAEARAAMILLHGRGATANSILSLADDLAHPAVAYLAPQAVGNVWYPYSFLMPIKQNEPNLSSALATVDVLVEHVLETLPAERMLIGGFSQGACLTLEYVARHPRRFGGVLAFSGGLIGPDGTPRDYPGNFEGTPVFIGCSDVDHHIPKARVLESADVLTRMGAAVDSRIYPGMGHLINSDEIAAAQQILQSVVTS